MLALISPAKKQDFTPTTQNLPHNQPCFQEETSSLVNVMRHCDAECLKNLMKISPNLAELNTLRFQTFAFPHTVSNAKQAALAFQGDTYVGLDAASFSEQDWNFANHHLAILSGLYGLLMPLDLIQAHRLEMGTPLRTQWGNNLYQFWGNRIVDRINQIQENTPDAWVIHLASEEYFKAVPTKQLKANLLTPQFKEKQPDGSLRVIGIKAKRARGKMARFIVQNRLTHPKGLQDFQEDGYRYRPELSDRDQWVFCAGFPLSRE